MPKKMKCVRRPAASHMTDTSLLIRMYLQGSAPSVQIWLLLIQTENQQL